MKKHLSTILLSIISAFILIGCAQVVNEPKPTVPDRPQSGKALVFFYRRGGFANCARGMEVTDGEKIIGDLSSGSYFVYQAEPGSHRFIVNGHDEDTVAQTLVAGQTYYFRCRFGGLHYPVDSVTPDKASAQMKHLQRVHWNGH